MKNLMYILFFLFILCSCESNVPDPTPTPTPEPTECGVPDENTQCWGINGKIKYFTSMVEAEAFVESLSKCGYSEITVLEETELYTTIMVEYFEQYCKEV